MKRKINKGIIGSRTPEYTLVENPPMDDKVEIPLKSSDSLKQEVEIHNFLYVSTYGRGSAFTENGAISYATIGTVLLDQFAKAGTCMNRNIEEVWAEQSALWAEDAKNALKFPFYLRLITRKVKSSVDNTTNNVQRGLGLRDEAFKRLLWIAKYHPDEFYRNLWILPLIGSWKDLWTLLVSDDSLNKDIFFSLMVSGIQDEHNRELVLKYLPRIRSNNKCTTERSIRLNELAKSFRKFVHLNYRSYRKFKATGKAHQFQQIICDGLYEKINWNMIPGKALLKLVSGKFLDNHNLVDSYIKWIDTQDVVKFNGYPFELSHKCGYGMNDMSRATKITIDKQFDNLIKTAKDNDGALKGNILCALDTSGSMSINVMNNVSAYDVCVSLGIYFSELNVGEFHNTVAMFDKTSRLLKLNGSFTDKLSQIQNDNVAWGNTDFQSLIDLIVKTRYEHPEIPLEDYPKTLLVVSDMQFDPVKGNKETNYEAAKRKLSKAFPEEFVNDFKIVWWFCSDSRTTDFPSTMDEGGTYMFSGFDGSIISLLLGGEEVKNEKGEVVKPTMEEIVNKAFNQEILLMVG